MHGNPSNILIFGSHTLEYSFRSFYLEFKCMHSDLENFFVHEAAPDVLESLVGVHHAISKQRLPSPCNGQKGQFYDYKGHSPPFIEIPHTRMNYRGRPLRM